jgi:hypothetical protein
MPGEHGRLPGLLIVATAATAARLDVGPDIILEFSDISIRSNRSIVIAVATTRIVAAYQVFSRLRATTTSCGKYECRQNANDEYA